MKNTRVIFPDLRPAAPLATPASVMSMSLSTGGYSIIPPTGLSPFWVAIVTDLLAVASRRSRQASFARPGGPEVSLWGQFDARSQMPVSVCRSVSRLLCCFEVSVFLSAPSRLACPLNCVDLRICSLMLTRTLSSDGPGMLGVSSQRKFDGTNQLLLSALWLMTSLLTHFAVYVCQDTRHCCPLLLPLYFQVVKYTISILWG